MDTCSCAADFLTDPDEIVVDQESGKVYSAKEMTKPKVTFYTIGCPMCIALKNMLDSKHIEYDTISGVDKLIELKIASAPMLKVGDKMLTYREALVWLAGQK
jgi:glutaredoxin-related protein